MFQNSVLVGKYHGLTCMVQQRSSSLEIPGCQGMMDSIKRKSIAIIPVRSAQLQRGNHLCREALLEAGVQQVCKQVMVAEPHSLIIQRNNKDIRAVEGLKDSLSVLATCHGLTQPCIHPL